MLENPFVVQSKPAQHSISAVQDYTGRPPTGVGLSVACGDTNKAGVPNVSKNISATFPNFVLDDENN